MNEQKNKQVDRGATILGNNNGQVGTGGFVIQVGAINGGEVNLRPFGSAPTKDDPALPLPAAEREELLALRQALTDRFGEEELRDLAFDLAVEYDDLPGSARKDKARELVTFCRRHDRLDELKLAISRRRPGAL